MFSPQAQKAERDATDLKGSMRKRMEFLDLDWELRDLFIKVYHHVMLL